MRYVILMFLATFACNFSYTQEQKGKLFFETDINLGLLFFEPKTSIDPHFQVYMNEMETFQGANIGIGWFFKNNLTLGLKTGGSLYSWDENRFKSKFEESYIDTFIYISQINNDGIILTQTGVLLFSAEIGYLMKMNKLTVKPNLNIGLNKHKFNEMQYSLRTPKENLPSFATMNPTVKTTISIGGSVDIGIPNMERFFLHFGYTYSPLNVKVSLDGYKNDDSPFHTVKQYKFQGQKIDFGVKFALLKRK